jgi:hypothetical protein
MGSLCFLTAAGLVAVGLGAASFAGLDGAETSLAGFDSTSFCSLTGFAGAVGALEAATGLVAFVTAVTGFAFGDFAAEGLAAIVFAAGVLEGADFAGATLAVDLADGFAIGVLTVLETAGLSFLLDAEDAAATALVDLPFEGVAFGFSIFAALSATLLSADFFTAFTPFATGLLVALAVDLACPLAILLFAALGFAATDFPDVFGISFAAFSRWKLFCYCKRLFQVRYRVINGFQYA